MSTPTSRAAPLERGLRIEYLDLEELRPALRNPKEHAGGAIEASVEAFGFAEPIVLDERTQRIVAGHGRREALLRLKAAGRPAPRGVRVKAPRWLVPVVRGWSSKDDAAAESFLLASNQLPIAGGCDQPVLDAMLRDAGQVDPLRFGFTEADVRKAWDHVGDDAGVEAPSSRDGSRGRAPSRQLLLVYPDAEYEDVLRRLEVLRDRHRVKSNTEAILLMLRQEYGTPAQ